MTCWISSPPCAPRLNFPQVSFLKADGYQDGHAGYSDPLDEQTFIVDTITFLEQQRDWSSTLVVIAYDDSGTAGTIIQIGPIINQSAGTADALTGPRRVRQMPTTALPGATNPANLHALGRCGYGPEASSPCWSSPYAIPKANFVGHSVT